MLSKVLSKETCAKCRFCCSFRRCSLWETPLFPKNECEKLSKDNEYGTQDSEEEAACDYLDEHKGCILSQEDKPFDCKIWPLRIMRKGDRLVIALTPTCPSIGREPSEELKELVNNGLGEVIYNYAKENPFIIKEYKEGFPIIMG